MTAHLHPRSPLASARLRLRLGEGLAALVMAAALAACGGGGGTTESSGGEGSGSDGGGGSGGGGGVPPTATAGRLLASNCFQCHGTGGTGGLKNIRGEADEVRKYRSLASRPAGSDIMAAHAQGYTDAQITAIINYFQQ
jgi:hypothetical protein